MQYSNLLRMIPDVIGEMELSTSLKLGPSNESYRVPLCKGKILIIDDVPGMRERLERWLGQMAYRYAFVDSDRQAKAMLKNENFDTIVYSHEFRFPYRCCVC